MSDENYSRVKKVFAAILQPEDLAAFNPEATMDDIEGWDSLNFLEVILAVEAEFGLRIDGLDAASMTTVPMILEYLERNT